MGMNMLKTKAKDPTHAVFGKTLTGETFAVPLSTGPHWIVAGSTGMGKSVTVNSILVSMLSHAHPDELKIFWVDPKMVEAAAYVNLPHCPINPIINMADASAFLEYLVEEMERRYRILAETGFKHMKDFNEWFDTHRAEAEAKRYAKMPYFVCVIDEWADLVMQDKSVDDPVMRLGQKARASGIHVMIATQRPSAEILSSKIKANIASRICMGVVDSMNSLIVLDQTGAEKLNTPGDSLVMYKGDITRVKFPYLSDDEIANIFAELRSKYPKSEPIDYKQFMIDHGTFEWAEEYDEDTPWEEKHLAKKRMGLMGRR